jgi:hypothetical protein
MGVGWFDVVSPWGRSGWEVGDSPELEQEERACPLVFSGGVSDDGNRHVDLMVATLDGGSGNEFAVSTSA